MHKQEKINEWDYLVEFDTVNKYEKIDERQEIKGLSQWTPAADTGNRNCL